MAVFLPIVPNWQNGVRDTYEFKTNIFTSRDGSEQRRSERMQPRRTINAAILLDGERLRAFSDAIHLARDGKVEIPDFSADGAVLTATAPNGATVLSVDHVPAWLKNDVVCTLLSGRGARKVTVDFATGNQVILKHPLASAVGHGAQLLPMLPASLGTTNTISLHTTVVATSAIAFEIEPGFVTRNPDPLPVDGGPTGETTQFFGPAAIFYGRYVLLRKPNFLQQPTVAFNIPYETVDYQRGVTKTFTPVPVVSRTLTATFTALSHAEAMALLDVFIRARGRSGEIFVPTWGSDFPPVVLTTGKNIRVSGHTIYDAYSNDPAYKTILLRKTNGTLIPHEIQGMQIDGADTLIATTDNVGATAAEIAQISWMFSARFAADALTVQWLTNGAAHISMSFVTLANLAVEVSFGNNWILATGFWRDAGQWQDGSTWED